MEINFDKKSIDKTISQLTNQIWKLIPMRENNEDWEKQLDTVIIRIAGLNEMFSQDWRFLELYITLKGLRFEAPEMDFSLYRKTVFECIGQLQGLKQKNV